ncbi:MAG: chemotaxis protein CheB [Porticoccaceae bacterium]|nr:chemotaxis protein CheB [Porticoccaceae bacterium]
MSLKVGILTHDSAQSYSLKTALSELGHFVVYFNTPDLSATDQPPPTDVELWIVTAQPGAKDRIPIDNRSTFSLLLDGQIPSLLSPGYEAWKRALRDKINRASYRMPDNHRFARARRLWVLAASTGGLKAVEEFLSLIDPAPGRGVGLLYAQHIEGAHVDQLEKMVTRSSNWGAQMADTGRFVLEGSVSIVRPDHKIRITPERKFQTLKAPWGGSYRPSIDYVAEMVARKYGAAAGLIVFTGMGDDGVLGSQHIRENGGQVWAQQPKTCMVSAMPDAVINAGTVDFTGSISELAAHFQQQTLALPAKSTAS